MSRPTTPSVADVAGSSPNPISRAQSKSNSVSPSTPRTYDPRALLAPRTTPRQTHKPDLPAASEPMTTIHSGNSSPSRGVMDIETISQKRELNYEPSNGGSRIAELYGAQPRAEQPRKKVKKDVEGLESDKNGHASFSRRSNGLMGDYMKPEPGKNVSLTVDLTNGRIESNAFIVRRKLLTV